MTGSAIIYLDSPFRPFQYKVFTVVKIYFYIHKVILLSILRQLARLMLLRFSSVQLTVKELP